MSAERIAELEHALREYMLGNQWQWVWENYQNGTVIGLCRFDCHARAEESVNPEQPIVTIPHDHWCPVVIVGKVLEMHI